MLEIITPFTIGLLGSLHCIGMCGPLVLACSLKFRGAAAVAGPRDGTYGATASPGTMGMLSGTALYHLAFHTGRIITYGILGTMAAGLFHSLEVQRFSMLYRGGVTVACGIVLLAIGLYVSGLVSLPNFLAQSAPGVLGRWMGSLAGSPGVASKLGLGLAAGFLPCGLSWAMLVTAAGTLNPVMGFATMISFGLGTVPLLLLTGISASFISTRVRLLGERAAAVAIIIMALVMLGNGILILSGPGDHCSKMIEY